ncbi:MAG: VWA domain-containing protein, partial [Thiovulaceae bacterium]|nr:VWA domain-containing protein [Sulfurimonadaceae bacterium]
MGAGDDTITIGANDANDYLVVDGGTGQDTVNFDGSAVDYFVTTNSDGETVVVSLDGSGDTSILRNIETIKFTEDKIIVDTQNHVVTGENEASTMTITANSVQAVSLSTNLVLTFDVSGSMNSTIYVDGVKTTRFQMAKNAMIDMVESYASQGETNVNLTLFGKTALNIGWMSATDALNYLETLTTANSGVTTTATNFEAAIEKTVITSFEEHQADRTLAFFLSDGEPTAEQSKALGTGSSESNNNTFDGTTMKYVDASYFNAWNDFVDSNNIQLNVVGVGSGISDTGIKYLNMLASAYDGSSANIVSDNADDLAAALAPKEQTIAGNVLGNFDFGDETGSITSITVDGTAYTVDTFPTQGVVTPEGSKLTFDFETGNYTYTVTVSDVSRDFNEVFQVTATDENGDVATVDLKINIDDTRIPAPNVPVIEMITDTDDTNTNSVRVSGSGTPNSIVTLFIAGEAVATTQVESDGTWSYDLTVADGLHALTAQASLNGESSSVSAVSTLSVDNGIVIGGAEADYLAGVQSARGGEGDDFISGTSGNDVLLGESGNDTISGEAGNDFIDGGTGNDFIDGGVGADYVLAGAGDDTIVFDAQDRMMDGGEGYDTLLIEDNQTIDFGGLSEHISNIETIKLGEGKQDVTLTLEDVLSMTDDAHTLRIDGDADDTVHLLEQGEWKLGDSIVEGENSYNVYTAESGDATVTLQINTQVHTEES